MALHFSKEEFKSRKSNILNSIKEQNIDALLMFRQESMYWLTGYDTFGYVFFQTLVLDQKGNLILLTRAPDLRQAQNTSIINDIRIWVDKDGSNPTDDLKIILDELNLKGKKIGIEYEAYGLTGRNAIKLNQSLENYCSIEDKSELITKLRVVKSEEEITYVRKAANLADLALEEVWKYAKSGASEAKILAQMNKVIFEGGGDYPANEFINLKIDNNSIDDYNFSIHSLIGNQMDFQQEKISDNEMRFVINSFNSGYYFILIDFKNENRRRIIKFSKN